MNEPLYKAIGKKSGREYFGFGWCYSDYTDEYLLELGQVNQDIYLYTHNGVCICKHGSVEVVDALINYTKDTLPNLFTFMHKKGGKVYYYTINDEVAIISWKVDGGFIDSTTYSINYVVNQINEGIWIIKDIK